MQMVGLRSSMRVLGTEISEKARAKMISDEREKQSAVGVVV
jgi:hypothetical protein